MTGSRNIDELLSRAAPGCEALSVSDASNVIAESYALRPAVPNRSSILSRAIEVEVIPRLMLAHRTVLPKSKRRQLRGVVEPRVVTCLFSNDDVAEFARLAVEQDGTVAEAFIDALIKQGATVQQVFSRLFAPAARRLGELWEADQCTFTDVTIGLSRIQLLVQRLGAEAGCDVKRPLVARSVLLVPMPGEHHSLGLIVVEENLRRAGWGVWAPCNLTRSQVLDTIAEERFDMVGVSVTRDVCVAELGALVASIREASINRSVVVMVGGRPFNDRPGLVDDVAADGTDCDGSGVVATFEKLVKRRRSH